MDEVKSPVFAVYYPEDIITSPKDVFQTVKDAAKFANSPEAKLKGARFKRFDTPQQALCFLAGEHCPSPVAPPSQVPPTPAEPTIPFPSVSRIEMNKLKKTLEANNVEEMMALVGTNPRYLINTGSDTAAIVQEGFRYNALHIAARKGAVEVAMKVVDQCWDLEMLKTVYGTDMEDLISRRDNIIASYLNTPDKGALDTPLHIAAKWGYLAVLRVLINQPLCSRHARNKDGMTASEAVCTRYHGEDKGQVAARMQLLFNGLFVPLYRTADNSQPARIQPPGGYPTKTIQDDVLCISSPVDCSFRIAAFAGPFASQQTADEFHKKWRSSDVETRRCDVDKGAERVGRLLALAAGVGWREQWHFLGDELIDMRSPRGLEKLEAHFRNLRIASIHPKQACGGGRGEWLGVRRRLFFDDEEEEKEKEQGAGDAGVGVEGKENDAPEEESDGEYEDACSDLVAMDDVVSSLAGLSTSADDSLCGLTQQMGGLCIASPPSAPQGDVPIGESPSPLPCRVQQPRVSDADDFETPPSTPPPVYLLDMPSKTDNDLFLALGQLCDEEELNKFEQIDTFRRKMARFSQTARADWPAKDSPRRSKLRSRFTERN